MYIDWQNHLKPRTAKTKQRNEVRGSTKKIVAQKGTGGARHASRKGSFICWWWCSSWTKRIEFIKLKKLIKKYEKIGFKLKLYLKKILKKILYLVDDFKKEVKKQKNLIIFLIKNNLTKLFNCFR